MSSIFLIDSRMLWLTLETLEKCECHLSLVGCMTLENLNFSDPQSPGLYNANNNNA